MFPLKHDANLEASAENHENSSFNVSSVAKRKESLPFLIPEFRLDEDDGLKFTTFSFLHRKFVWKLPAKRSSIATLEGSLSCLKDNLNEDEKAFKDSYEQFMCVFHTVHAMSQAMPKLDKTKSIDEQATQLEAELEKLGWEDFVLNGVFVLEGLHWEVEALKEFRKLHEKRDEDMAAAVMNMTDEN